MKPLYLLLFSLLSLSSCIQDDIVFDTVEPVLQINSTVDTIAIGSSFQFEASYRNNVGIEEEVEIIWESTQADVISIDGNGFAEALQSGRTVITAIVDDGVTRLEDSREVHTGEVTTVADTGRSGTIITTSTYLLTGDFMLTEDGNAVTLDIAENYQASTALPGLYVYLTNNPNTTANALEIGAVEVFAGAHSYTIPNVDINDYSYVLYFCKPFNVKVGDGEIQ